MFKSSLEIPTPGRSIISITDEVQEIVRAAGVNEGLCTVFVHHTSASLFINENADDDVKRDLESFLSRLVPDGDPLYRHQDEGPDDMPSHVRSLLTATSLSVPVDGGRADLGTWQGIFLWEHRHAPHRRRLTVCVIS